MSRGGAPLAESDYRELIVGVCEAMTAQAEGDLMAAVPDNMPPELVQLVATWQRTLDASLVQVDRIHGMDLPLIAIGRDDFCIKSLNGSALRLFQYENAGELVYESVSRLIPAIDGVSDIQDYFEKMHVWGRRRDRSIFHLEAEVVSKSDVRELIVSLRDVTNRKALESAMEETRDTALRTAELQGHFLATMSHEIRTPVNGILGMAHLLLDTVLEPEQRSHVQAISTSGNTLLTLVNDILDLSKIESGNMALEPLPTDFRKLVNEVALLMGPKAEEQGDRIVVDFPEDTHAVYEMDSVRMRQVITNLVGNAVKFTQGGVVTIRVKNTIDDGVVRCDVVDSGIGIPADKLSTIFDKFTQAESSTTRRFGGTGLGLAICRQIAGLMGGNLEVRSVLGKGSVFSLEVPVTPVAALAGGVFEADASGRVQLDLGGVQVLVAEDNAINQVIARRTLEKMGCVVTVVDNGADADAQAETGRFGIVLMDCMMPDTDGFEGTQRIRDREKVSGERIPIIALTAKAMKGDREKCLEAGMSDYLSKPFTPEGLRRVIETWCFCADAGGEKSSELTSSEPAKRPAVRG